MPCIRCASSCAIATAACTCSKPACTSSGANRPRCRASTGPGFASSRCRKTTTRCWANGWTSRKVERVLRAFALRAAKRHHGAFPDHDDAAMTAAPQDNLAGLYPAHLSELKRRAEAALALAQREHLVIAAGRPAGRFLDDTSYPFRANPHFVHWLPLTDAPGSWIVHTPGAKPKLVFLQPHDYWHVVPAAPAGYWVEHFEIVTIRNPEEARAHLPKDASRCAIVGDASAVLDGYAPDNPPALMDYLHWQRSFKTDYELAMLRVASRIGARGHIAARTAFRNGASEFEIHVAYLAATHLAEHQLPYDNIIALDRHGAVLHYTHFDRNPPTHAHSFLIDAGGQFHGYNSDITRTYAAADAVEFKALVDAVERAQ